MSKRFFIIFVSVLFIAVAFTGCKKAKPGVTDTEIKIGQWGPQTGPAALWGAVGRGTDCYFKMINDEGGINGRKLVYFLRDDAYQPAQTKAEVKKLVEGEGVFAFVGGVGSSPGMAVKKYLADNQIPWVSPSAGSSNWCYPTSKYLFGTYPLYSHEAAAMVDYAVKTLKKTKIAVFYQNDDYGKLGLHGAEYALKKHNLKLVEKVSSEVADTDLSSQGLKLKTSGAEVVLLFVLPKHGAIILGTAAKIGFKPQFMASSTLSDNPIMFKITKGQWKDVIVARFYINPMSDHPLMVKYRAAWKKYAPNERWGTFFLAGFLFAEPLVEALRRTGKDLTTENFLKAMESIKDFQGTGAKITFGPDQHQGTNAVSLAKIVSADNKDDIDLTDWSTPDIDMKEILKMEGR
jgi:ABC-type branched-subunit amino acid transport system substrate-binding protein